MTDEGLDDMCRPFDLDFHPQQAFIPTGERITIAVGIVTVIPRKKHYPRFSLPAKSD